MTLPLERARTRRPITWLTVLGVILLPVLIGGVLVAALYNPTERLDAMTAAVVNSDEPVTVNGQYTPLGRQLTAGLVQGSDAAPSNLTWVVSNDKDAAAGLADGTYQAVVTIPANFSAAATSSGQALQGSGTAEKATIQVTTPPDAKIVDDAITRQITETAASVMGRTLSTVTLENVFLGYSTLGTQLTTATQGATTLADGATSASAGASSLADGVRQLGSGADALGTGAAGIADGAGNLGGGAGSLATGLDTIAGGVSSSASGATALASGLSGGADTLQNGAKTQELLQGVNGVQQLTQGVAAGTAGVSSSLDTLAAQCAASGAAPAFCTDLAAVATVARTTRDSAAQADRIAPGVAAGVPALIAGAADGMRQSAAGATQLADGLTRLADGTTQSAAGARGLQSGAAQLQSGASQLASGADQLAEGAGSAATGATSLAGGVSQLADGAGSLADGLGKASTSLPSYSEAQAQNLAEVVSDPVEASGADGSLFGAAAVPLLAALALWIGGLATYVAMQSVTRRAVTSRRSSVALAARGLLPGAAIGALQGILVAGVVQLAASYSWSEWFAFAGLAMLTGVAFAAINQALVAAFRGVGRFLAALVAVLAIATGIVSTVPGWLTSIAGLVPTAPAYQALLGALTGAGGIGAAVAGLLIWAVLAFAVTVLAVTRRRTVAARDLVAASPLPA